MQTGVINKPNKIYKIKGNKVKERKLKLTKCGHGQGTTIPQ